MCGAGVTGKPCSQGTACESGGKAFGGQVHGDEVARARSGGGLRRREVLDQPLILEIVLQRRHASVLYDLSAAAIHEKSRSLHQQNNCCLQRTCMCNGCVLGSL